MLCYQTFFIHQIELHISINFFYGCSYFFYTTRQQKTRRIPMYWIPCNSTNFKKNNSGQKWFDHLVHIGGYVYVFITSNTNILNYNIERQILRLCVCVFVCLCVLWGLKDSAWSREWKTLKCRQCLWKFVKFVDTQIPGNIE